MKKRSKEYLRKAGRSFAQLVVVFAGVFLAFTLDEYRENRRDERRRQQVYELVADELRELVAGASQPEECYAGWDKAVYRPFNDPYERGEMPRPVPYVVPGHSFRGGGAWNSLIAASGDIVEVDLISDIEDILDLLAANSDEADAFRASIDAVLLPDQDKPISHFYDTDSSRLNGRYRWYMRRLANLRRLRQRYCERGIEVLVRLETAIETDTPYHEVPGVDTDS